LEYEILCIRLITSMDNIWYSIFVLIGSFCIPLPIEVSIPKNKLSRAGPSSAKVEFSTAFLSLIYSTVHLNFWENSSLQCIEFSPTRMRFTFKIMKISLKRIKFFLKRMKLSCKRIKFSPERMKFLLMRMKFSLRE